MQSPLLAVHMELGSIQVLSAGWKSDSPPALLDVHGFARFRVQRFGFRVGLGVSVHRWRSLKFMVSPGSALDVMSQNSSSADAPFAVAHRAPCISICGTRPSQSAVHGHSMVPPRPAFDGTSLQGSMMTCTMYCSSPSADPAPHPRPKRYYDVTIGVRVSGFGFR